MNLRSPTTVNRSLSRRSPQRCFHHAVILIRAVFVLVVAGLGVRLSKIVGENELANPYIVFIAVMLGAIIIVAGDLLTPRKRIQTISALYFGLIVGIFLSNLVN